MKYKTVVVDPPWNINFDEGGVRVRSISGGRFGFNKDSYKKMETFNIFDFPINDFAAEECLLFLWVTCGKLKGKPIIEIGFELLRHWAFEYHSMITWVKPSPFCVFSPLMSQTEHVLFAWRGNFRKLTHLWGKFPPIEWRSKPSKSKTMPAPRGSKTGIQNPNLSSAERAIIPYDFSLAVCIAAEGGSSQSTIEEFL